MSVVEKPEFIDLAIIVPLEEELLQVMGVFPSKENRSTSTCFMHLVDAGIPDVKCIVVQQSHMGKSACHEAAQNVVSHYDVGLLVCLGIAGSLSNDIDLADVCYTGTLMDVYDNSKTGDAEDGRMTVKFSPVHSNTPFEITAAFNFIRTQPELQALYSGWLEERSLEAQKMVPDSIPGRQHKPYIIRKPKTTSGIIVCGSVSQSKVYNDALASVDRKVLAIETESGGLFAAAKSAGVSAIAIRAISDYADASKTRLESETAGAVRILAAGNAATFLKLQLKNPYVLDVIRQRKLQRSVMLPYLEDAKAPDEFSSSRLLQDIAEDIDHHLRELCPEYKLQSFGYKLPVPRAKRREASKAMDAKVRSPEFEIRMIVETQRLIMLDVPRTYPDQALPWMIAHDLLATEIESRQVIPLVVNGDAVSPPRSDISRISGLKMDDLAKRPGIVPIIIVDNCPLLSKTKLRFLFSEVERYPNARFVFISRGNGAQFFSSDAAVQFQVELFDICDVSFSELAYFVERNFQLSGSEAEVIAYRLQETFARYALSAHPSYLAAIPNTTLAALVNANRRSELIQLAVDGSLSFIVADDTSDISLSRTTRSRFLQKLVKAVRVDAKSFDESDLIEFTKAFAEEFDFEINPLAFIAAFVDRGILHFDGNRVMVSLPYIESYLLAKELLVDPSNATRYFNFGSSDFDYPSFDIYAELGPAEAIVKLVEGELERSIEALPGIVDRGHAILTLQATAKEGAAAAKFTSLHSQMQTAIDEVIAGKPASKQKQQILDMRNKVRSIAAARTRGNVTSSGENEDSNIQLLNTSLRSWAAGVILINSAAEHLSGKVKQNIAAKIITLSSLILDLWTDIHKKVDFKSIRQSLISDDSLSNFCEVHGLENGKHVKATVKTLMGNMVDLIEETFVTTPFITMLTGTCGARQKVLGRSLAQVSPSERIEKLIHSIWLLETNPVAGQEPASSLIRDLPHSPVLRLAICNLLVTSAFWNHSNSDNKKCLVAVANTAIQPFAAKVDQDIFKADPNAKKPA